MRYSAATTYAEAVIDTSSPSSMLLAATRKALTTSQNAVPSVAKLFNATTPPKGRSQEQT
jgi:hypothetical protein